MKQQFMISAVGPNVIGIVAQIAREIHACKCNFEDSGMSVLGDHFALMIRVTGEGEDLFAQLIAACERLRQNADISFALFPLKPTDQGELPPAPTPNYELRVKGIDRQGIVYRTSQLLASRNIGIVNMQTSLSPAIDGETPLFTMKTQLEVPAELHPEILRRDLESLAEDINDVISLKRIKKHTDG